MATDELPQGERSSFDEEPEPAELTLDELFNQGINRDEVKKAERDLLLPAATYTTIPPLQLKLSQNDEGRPFARFFGLIQATVNDQEIRTNIGFSLSWERMDRVDRETGESTGKPDNAYKLFTQAVGAYKKAYGEAAGSHGDVVKYLRDYPIRVRVIQIGVPTERNPNPDGEPGNMVVAVSAPLA